MSFLLQDTLAPPGATRSVLQHACAGLLRAQGADGAWHHAFDMGIMPDAQMAIFLFFLGHRDLTWTDGLVQRILHSQRSDGAPLVYLA